MFFIYNYFRENTIELSVSARIVISAQTPISFHLFTALKDTFGLGYSCFFFFIQQLHQRAEASASQGVRKRRLHLFMLKPRRNCPSNVRSPCHKWVKTFNASGKYLAIPRARKEHRIFVIYEFCVYSGLEVISHISWEFCWIKELDCLCKTLA